MLFIKDSNWIFFILSLVFLQLPVNQVSERIKPVEFVLDGSWYLSKNYSYNLHSQTISIIQQLEKGFTARFRRASFGPFFFLAICGSRPVTRTSGGSEAPQGAWPWQAMLKFTVYDRTMFCGGSLILRRWVLTTAYCIYGKKTSNIFGIRCTLTLGT